jgi:hypothetical protein
MYSRFGNAAKQELCRYNYQNSPAFANAKVMILNYETPENLEHDIWSMAANGHRYVCRLGGPRLSAQVDWQQGHCQIGPGKHVYQPNPVRPGGGFFAE